MPHAVFHWYHVPVVCNVLGGVMLLSGLIAKFTKTSVYKLMLAAMVFSLPRQCESVLPVPQPTLKSTAHNLATRVDCGVQRPVVVQHAFNRYQPTTVMYNEPTAQSTQLPPANSTLQTVTIFPDTQANVTVGGTDFLKYMTDVREVNIPANTTAGKGSAMVTHTGYFRWGIKDAHGKCAAKTSKCMCIPTQKQPLWGTDQLQDQVYFNCFRGDMSLEVGNVSVPVTMTDRYQVDIIINPPWPDTSLSTVPFVDPDVDWPRHCLPFEDPDTNVMMCQNLVDPVTMV